jgi:hypothetical protein
MTAIPSLTTVSNVVPASSPLAAATTINRIHVATAAIVKRLMPLGTATRSRGRRPRSSTMPTIMSLPYATAGPTETAYPEISWSVAKAKNARTRNAVGERASARIRTSARTNGASKRSDAGDISTYTAASEAPTEAAAAAAGRASGARRAPRGASSVRNSLQRIALEFCTLGGRLPPRRSLAWASCSV